MEPPITFAIHRRRWVIIMHRPPIRNRLNIICAKRSNCWRSHCSRRNCVRRRERWKRLWPKWPNIKMRQRQRCRRRWFRCDHNSFCLCHWPPTNEQTNDCVLSCASQNNKWLICGLYVNCVCASDTNQKSKQKCVLSSPFWFAWFDIFQFFFLCCFCASASFDSKRTTSY